MKELILASGQLIFWVLKNIVFAFFTDSYRQFFTVQQKLLFQQNPLFRLVQMDFLAIRNRFLCSEVFPSRETITEISGNQFLKKHLILTNVTDFRIGESHFLPFSQAAVNCYQWKQFILDMQHIFQPILHCSQYSIVYWKDCFILRFFQLVKTNFEIREKSAFKDGSYFCWSSLIFFSFLRYF